MSYLDATADLLQVARGALRERVMAKLDARDATRRRWSPTPWR